TLRRLRQMFIRDMPASSAVLDGEAIALRPDGRPHPFQVTGSRVGSRTDVAGLRERLPLTLFLFDVLHADGEDLLDAAGARRHEALSALVPEALRVPRLVADRPEPAAAFLADAVVRGHEGVGLTDEMLAWQTQRLRELAIPELSNDWVLHVRPELVVEVAFDGVQTSPRYPAGLALRFARVLRYRPYKDAAAADTVAAVRALRPG
nr:ATP-dependent DNA ligase [Micromonospora sp. DSM 115978]